MTATTSTSKRRGGFRFGAGRKKSRDLRFDPSHARRPELSFKHPVHVVLRTDWRVPRLRQRRGYEAIRRVLLHCLGGNDFRVIHISIQKNHLHLIVEAANKDALTRGMQRLAIRAARALNAGFNREGKVFAFRYSAKQIKTASYARNALSYVLRKASHCTLSGKRVEFPTSWAETALLRAAQRAVGYRRPSFEDLVWDRPATIALSDQRDLKIRYGPGMPEQLHS
jgi:REP element-mobilizing transposase RayT